VAVANVENRAKREKVANVKPEKAANVKPEKVAKREKHVEDANNLKRRLKASHAGQLAPIHNIVMETRVTVLTKQICKGEDAEVEAEKNAVNVVKEYAVNLVNVVKNVKRNVNVNVLHVLNTGEEDLDKEVVQHKYFPVQTLNTILRGQLDH
jgi:hypothetical protein